MSDHRSRPPHPPSPGHNPWGKPRAGAGGESAGRKDGNRDDDGDSGSGDHAGRVAAPPPTAARPSPYGQGPSRTAREPREPSARAYPPSSPPPSPAYPSAPRPPLPRPAPASAHAGASDFDALDGDIEDTISPSRERRNAELRLYGLNAVHAVFAARPQAIRKLYLSEARIPALQPLLAWCVANRVGYRVVDEADLGKLAASSHHEGVVADVLRAEPGPLSDWLRALPAGPQCAIWLDGVGNPHNLGAILRSAAHFGVAALLLPKHSPLALSGAAARVAEGGAEAVPMVRLGRSDNAIAQLRSVGFALAATVVQGGGDLFAAAIPERVVYVIGAEGAGMDRDLAAACDLRLSIPGSGAVESLNVAAATAVLLAAWKSRR